MSNPPTDLIDLLEARSGIVCFTGAGGKKTTMYRLAGLHGGKVAVTTTVHTPPFPKRLHAWSVVAPEDALLQQVVAGAAAHRRVAYATPSDKRARLGPVAGRTVDRLHVSAGFDVTLVKSDGARLRQIKAPAEDEPALPAGVTTIVPVVSIRVVGQPLTEEIAHRVDLISRAAGMRRGETITAAHVARLLASDAGGHKGVGTVPVVPVVNMVETGAQRRVGREIAERLLELRPRLKRVLLTAMTAAEPVVSVVS